MLQRTINTFRAAAGERSERRKEDKASSKKTARQQEVKPQRRPTYMRYAR